MALFGHRSTTSTRHATSTRRRTGNRWSRFGRKDPDRVAGGYKAALSNPNTTRAGRKHAKHELKAMGRGKEARVPLMTKIKRSLGIHSTPRRERTTTRRRRTLARRV